MFWKRVTADLFGTLHGGKLHFQHFLSYTAGARASFYAFGEFLLSWLWMKHFVMSIFQPRKEIRPARDSRAFNSDKTIC